MTVTVPLPQGGYPVHIQPGALRQTGALLAPLGSDRWAVTADESVAALYGGAVLDSLRSAGLSGQLLTFPAGEAHKTPEPWRSLRRQLAQSQSRLEKLEELRRQVRQSEQFSVESIGDIAYLMERRTQLKRVHTVMLLAGLPMSLLEVTGVVLWIVTGVWWPCAVYLLLSVPFGILISRYYFRRVAYLCPQCHTVFRPALKEAFFARHTPSARNLTCGSSGYLLRQIPTETA